MCRLLTNTNMPCLASSVLFRIVASPPQTFVWVTPEKGTKPPSGFCIVRLLSVHNGMPAFLISKITCFLLENTAKTKQNIQIKKIKRLNSEKCTQEHLRKVFSSNCPHIPSPQHIQVSHKKLKHTVIINNYNFTIFLIDTFIFTIKCFMLLLFVVVFVSLSDSLRTELSISFLFYVVVSLLHYYVRQTVDFCGPRSPGMWKLTRNFFS